MFEWARGHQAQTADTRAATAAEKVFGYRPANAGQSLRPACESRSVTPLRWADSGHQPLKAVLSGHARRAAKSLNVALRWRVRLGRVCPDQAGIHAVGDAIWVVCVGLTKHVGAADAKQDRQHPRSHDDHALG